MSGEGEAGVPSLPSLPGSASSPYADRDDHTLAGLIRDRDRDALAALYDRHGRAAYALAKRVVGDETLAEDVVQEAFLAVWNTISSYDGSRGSVSTWLLTMTHHRAVDSVRREQRHRKRRAEIDALDYEEPQAAVSVVEEVFAGLRRDRVRRALGELSADQREAIVLAYYEGYTQREIAGITGVPLGTVKTRTFAAIRRLRGALIEGGWPTGRDAGTVAGEEV